MPRKGGWPEFLKAFIRDIRTFALFALKNLPPFPPFALSNSRNYNRRNLRRGAKRYEVALPGGHHRWWDRGYECPLSSYKIRLEGCSAHRTRWIDIRLHLACGRWIPR